jgi:hypothetical protein
MKTADEKKHPTSIVSMNKATRPLIFSKSSSLSTVGSESVMSLIAL